MGEAREFMVIFFHCYNLISSLFLAKPLPPFHPRFSLEH